MIGLTIFIFSCAATPTRQELMAHEELDYLSRSELINDLKEQFEVQCIHRNIIPTICECYIARVSNSGVTYYRGGKMYTHRFSVSPIFRVGGAWYFIKSSSGSLDGIQSNDKTMALEIYHLLKAIHKKTPSKESAVNYISGLNAKASGLRFFETGKSGTQKKDRIYTYQFLNSDVRFICWELRLDHPASGRRIDFAINDIWHGPDGELIKNRTRKYSMTPGWIGSYYSGGHGKAFRWPWKCGEYHVDIFIEGQKVASGSFMIYDK